jgi:hypothetical protein
LLELIRRAAHDWVLYRTHNRLKLRQVAADAYIWLFEESPAHSWWRTRQEAGNGIMAFLTICEVLELDPTFVRNRIRELTIQQIMTAGRPSERRKCVDTACTEYFTEVNLDALSSNDIEGG